MDYEKLHKDTIGKLQEMVNSGKITVKTACSICADFVPESEDEKIRKAIIEGLREMKNSFHTISSIKIDDAIAYLEKRANNNMGISEATKQKLEDNLNKALEKETPESWNKFLDEQGEQNQKHFELKAGHWYICHRAYCCRADHLTIKEGEKVLCEEDGVIKGFVIKNAEKYFNEIYEPAPIEDERPDDKEIESFEAEHGKYYYCIKDYFCGGKKQASKGDVVQALRGLPIMGLKDASEYFLPVNFIKCNSAWSEEDEKVIVDIINDIECAKAVNYHAPKENYEFRQNWLNFLKNRVQVQNLTVTDEELIQAKKEAYNDALNKIEYHSDEPTFDDGWNAAIWYLKKKNINFQNTWKPSDKQMKALSIEMCGVDDPLFSLYQDLLKLREE